jgi:hypothetical protein
VSKNREGHRIIAKRVFSEIIAKEIIDYGGKQIFLRSNAKSLQGHRLY